MVKLNIHWEKKRIEKEPATVKRKIQTSFKNIRDCFHFQYENQ